ncbi:endonuclease domain-containing protein [Maribacter sp. 2-571]|uniref:endonuclease domain-containing protein n=1 Tax=Maribacter sp. 2-571 TaxID=3417569 RepID=UPI003D34AA49
MSYEKRHNKTGLKKYRKLLRKRLTPAEAFLWKHLSGKKLAGRKFRRQHSIDRYIADFYCASEKLVIELDGQVHMNPTAQAYDKKRTEHLERAGLTVIRFENKMVFENLTTVLEEITANFKK